MALASKVLPQPKSIETQYIKICARHSFRIQPSFLLYHLEASLSMFNKTASIGVCIQQIAKQADYKFKIYI